MSDEVITPPLQCGLNTTLDIQHKLTPIGCVVLAPEVKCSALLCSVQYFTVQCCVLQFCALLCGVHSFEVQCCAVVGVVQRAMSSIV